MHEVPDKETRRAEAAESRRELLGLLQTIETGLGMDIPDPLNYFRRKSGVIKEPIHEHLVDTGAVLQQTINAVRDPESIVYRTILSAAPTATSSEVISEVIEYLDDCIMRIRPLLINSPEFQQFHLDLIKYREEKLDLEMQTMEVEEDKRTFAGISRIRPIDQWRIRDNQAGCEFAKYAVAFAEKSVLDSFRKFMCYFMARLEDLTTGQSVPSQMREQFGKRGALRVIQGDK